MNWQDLPDGKEKYQAYLCSQEWWQQRNAVMRRCSGQCEKCNRRSADHVHHLTYIRKYCERLDDLMAVCVACHDSIHKPAELEFKELDSARNKICPLAREWLELWFVSVAVRPLMKERFCNTWEMSEFGQKLVLALLHGEELDASQAQAFFDLHKEATAKLAFTSQTAEKRVAHLHDYLSTQSRRFTDGLG